MALGATVIAAAGDLWAPYPNIAVVPVEGPAMAHVIGTVTARERKLPEISRHLSVRKQARSW